MIELQDALDAVVQVGVVLDEAAQAWPVPAGAGILAVRLFVVLRDHL